MSRELRHTRVVEFTSKLDFAPVFEQAADYLQENNDLTLISANSSVFVDGGITLYELFLTLDGTDD